MGSGAPEGDDVLVLARVYHPRSAGLARGIVFRATFARPCATDQRMNASVERVQ